MRILYKAIFQDSSLNQEASLASSNSSETLSNTREAQTSCRVSSGSLRPHHGPPFLLHPFSLTPEVPKHPPRANPRSPSHEALDKPGWQGPERNATTDTGTETSTAPEDRHGVPPSPWQSSTAALRGLENASIVCLVDGRWPGVLLRLFLRIPGIRGATRRHFVAALGNGTRKSGACRGIRFPCVRIGKFIVSREGEFVSRGWRGLRHWRRQSRVGFVSLAVGVSKWGSGAGMTSPSGVSPLETGFRGGITVYNQFLM